MSDRSRIAYVDGPRLRRALLAACRRGRQARSELNRINVFPVADGDTGTNLSLTLEAVADGLAGYRERRVDRVAASAARSALLGARGNCGMMLSQFLLGLSGGLEGRSRVSLGQFASALTAAARSLDAAVQNPVEGTILTVVRESALRAVDESAGEGCGDFADAMARMLETARESLARTPELLPVLAEAGVVDAGAQGFVGMVEGGVGLIREGDDGEKMAGADGALVVGGDTHPEWSPIGQAEHPFTHGTKRYCTEILVEGPELPGEQVVREALSEGSEELLVIRSEDILKVHLHTDHPRGAIDYCATLGTVVAHKAEDMPGPVRGGPRRAREGGAAARGHHGGFGVRSSRDGDARARDPHDPAPAHRG